jgi:hypothetical protein
MEPPVLACGFRIAPDASVVKRDVKSVEAIRQFASVPWLEKLEAVFVECQMYDQDIEFYNEEIKPRLQKHRYVYD